MEVPVPRSVRGWLVPVAVGLLLIVGALVLTDPGDEAPPATGGPRAADSATGPNDAALGTDTSAPDAAGAPRRVRRAGATATMATRRTTGSSASGDTSGGAASDGGQSSPGPSDDPDPGGSDEPASNPLDQSGPSITGLRAGDEVPDEHDQIFDDGCGATSIGVAASVLDASGIRSVHLGWHFEARPDADGRRRVESGKTEMYRSSGRWGAQLGPFEPGTAPSGSVVITWWVDAVDMFGNVSRVYAPDSPDDERVTLSPCG